MTADSLIVYYNINKDGDIKAMIDKLAELEDSVYFKRSKSEIAKLILIPALKEELKKHKIDTSSLKTKGKNLINKGW